MTNATKQLALRNKSDRAALAEKQFKRDIQDFLNTQGGRRLLWAFLDQTGCFRSPFNTNSMQQSHAIGWADAGRWWLAALQAACPEKLTVMQTEAAKAAKEEALLEESEEKQHD